VLPILQVRVHLQGLLDGSRLLPGLCCVLGPLRVVLSDLLLQTTPASTKTVILTPVRVRWPCICGGGNGEPHLGPVH